MAAHPGRAAALAMISTLLLVGPARAETQLAGYLGMSWTAPSTVTVGGQTFHGVSWASRSLEAPPYYGLRIGYFFAGNSGWGLALDFFHDKAYSSVGSLEPALRRLSFSHGLNHLTLDVDWRTQAGPLQPYVGAGIGTLVPHVEAESETASIDEYQWFRGVSVKLEAGVQWRVVGPAGIFLEYRLTFAHLGVSVPGGDPRTSLWTNHIVLGAFLAL